jgi:hypothetical protein
MARARKAQMLSETTALKIAKWIQKNPTLSIKDAALQFEVSYHQALYAHRKFVAGGFRGVAKPRKRVKPINDLVESSNPIDLINQQLHFGLAELTKDSKMGASERIKLLESSTKITKDLQHISLKNHLKRADADIIASLVRRYEPNATDDEVIKIYYEEVAKCQISQS